MIRAAFLSFYRSLTRHPLYSALNLLGLSFGIAVFIVLSLFVRFETSYEQWLPNADRIYTVAHRVNFVGREKRPFSYTSAVYALDVIRADRPRLTGTRIIPAYAVVRNGATIAEEAGQLVDGEFFSVFDLPMLAGDRQQALSAPDGLILSERMARKYFGRTDVVGRRLYVRESTYYGMVKEEEKAWRVMAVSKDIPANSNLKIDMVRASTAYGDFHELPAVWARWGRAQDARTFVTLPPGENAEILRKVSVSALKAFPHPGLRHDGARVNMNIEFDLRLFSGEHLSSGHLAAVVYGLAITLRRLLHSWLSRQFWRGL
ncbi:MAG: ABC transporter permease [Asticcacaulis sp.]|nr:ABC transporter permease [Asticcacaulis sp.]